MATWKKVLTVQDIDTDNSFANSSDALVPSQLAVKTYVDAQVDTVDTIGELGDVDANSASDGHILVYDSPEFVSKAVSGDVALSSGGAITINSDAVTYDKMQDIGTANRVLGKASTGTVEEVQVATDMVADDAITYAKMQHIATANRVLGATSAGAVTEVQVQHDMIADDAVDGDKLSDNISIAGTLSVGSTLTVTGDLDIAGNINTTNQTVTDLDIEDKTITLAVSDTAYASSGAMLTATNGAGIKLQNQYTSGSVDTEAANMSASLTWDKDAGLSGWKAKHYTGTANAVPIALMDIKADTGAPSGNSGGVGSFTYNSYDDELYIRVS